MELDAALAGLAVSGPTEAALFEPFCRDPESGSVKVEQLVRLRFLLVNTKSESRPGLES